MIDIFELIRQKCPDGVPHVRIGDVAVVSAGYTARGGQPLLEPHSVRGGSSQSSQWRRWILNAKRNIDPPLSMFIENPGERVLCPQRHCHLFVNTSPTFSAADVVHIVKTNTAKVLLREFKEFFCF